MNARIGRALTPIELDLDAVEQLDCTHNLALAVHGMACLECTIEGDPAPNDASDILWKVADLARRLEAEKVVRVAGLVGLITEKGTANALEHRLQIFHLHTELAAHLKSTALTHCRRV